MRPPASMSPSTLSPNTLVCADAGPARPSRFRCFHDGLLSLERVARRVVGAVDHGVAVRARAPQDEPERGSVPAVRARGMARFHVALLAEPWLGELEHLFVVRPVGGLGGGGGLLDRG